MVGNRLTQRVAALEGGSADQWRGAWAWMVRREPDTQAETIAKYEAEHGPLNGQPVIMWSPYRAAPCA